MPNIVYDVKLDFKDVLLRPKRSTLKSRADVDLYREIKFRNSKQVYNGVPIMASNMDTVGTFEMAKTLAKVRISIFSFLIFNSSYLSMVASPACTSSTQQRSGNSLLETTQTQ